MDNTQEPKFSNSDSPMNDDELQELLQTLGQPTIWYGRELFKYQGFWITASSVPLIISSQKHFEAKHTNVVLASMPKSGTTWLKALTFTIANRSVYSIDQSPLLASNPHGLVPFIEYGSYTGQENRDGQQHILHPRIFSTHMPFNALPETIHTSRCKIIYICRNPLDNFISHHYFSYENELEKNAVLNQGLDEAFDSFCRGIFIFGPYWDHVLGYWNAHCKNPRHVLFLKYECLKEDIKLNVKKIAEFMGLPFSVEEEKQGVIEQISSLCSFEKLSGLEVNKTGKGNLINIPFKNSSFFRKGEVRDWTNYLTPEMAQRYKKVLESKLGDSGLTIEI